MELAKLILEFVKVLVWPVTALIIAFVFRADSRNPFPPSQSRTPWWDID
jgi:hypothetical protein